jgi:hypothetical protein
MEHGIEATAQLLAPARKVGQQHRTRERDLVSHLLDGVTPENHVRTSRTHSVLPL